MSIEPKPDALPSVVRPITPPAAPPSVLTIPSLTSASLDGPPSLNYTLYKKHRRLFIFIFWSLCVFDSVAMPIVLYFALWYHTSLSPNAVFSIVTAAIGGVSIVDYGWRFWKLVKKDSDCRVRGMGRWHFDFFHWCFTLMWMILMIELIVGTVPDDPPIRLLSMPLSSALYTFSLILLTLDLMRYTHTPSPFPISSQPKGSVPRPGIYFILEDVIAVDGYGTAAFRDALGVRYDSSRVFREMLARLSVSWWSSGLAVAVLTTVLVFTLPEDAAFVVGWSVPFVWAGIWAFGTTLYVRRELKRETDTWGKVEAA